MTTLTNHIIEAGFANQVLTGIDLNNFIEGSNAAKYAMVNKALQKEELIRIRHSLYMLAYKYRSKKIS
jgi:hypothetical protein